MGTLMARARGKQAKMEAKGAAKATKMAAKDAALALKELTSALVEQARESDALAKAQAKGAELTDLARDKIHDRGLDDKAAELTERIRAADSTQQAVDAARKYSDEGLGILGAWLASGQRARKLGVQPRKRRFPAWLAALLGMGVGYAVAVLTRPSEGAPLGEVLTIPPAEKPTEDRVRTALGQDPRTADLPKLNINVAEGTVFVRGPALPEGVDEGTLREIIIRIPGVEDVDLQLSTA